MEQNNQKSNIYLFKLGAKKSTQQRHPASPENKLIRQTTLIIYSIQIYKREISYLFTFLIYI